MTEDARESLLLALADKLAGTLRGLSRLQSELGREGDADESWEQASELDDLVEKLKAIPVHSPRKIFVEKDDC